MARKLKNWIEAYLKYVEHSEAPDIFHKWTAIGTIAGALRRCAWFDMGYFKWYPNFFIFFVAPPGVVSKSTTVALGIDLLREVPGIKFGPTVITWQALIKSLEESQEDVLTPSGEMYPMAALTISASELGTFLDPRNREMIDVLVDLWDGRQGAWEKVTKTSSSERIENPWIHIMGCTTPSWIAENFSDYFFGGGLASRSILVYAEDKRKLVAYPKRHFDDKMPELKGALIHDLDQIANIWGEYQATSEAYEWGEKWYKKHWKEETHDHIEGEKFKAYLARKQTHIHKVAMILAASESDRLVLEARHLETANKEISSLEYSMPHVYGKMNVETEARIAADVLTHLKRVKSQTKTELFKEFYKTITFATFEKVIVSLVNTGIVRLSSTQNGTLVTLKDDPRLSRKE